MEEICRMARYEPISMAHPLTDIEKVGGVLYRPPVGKILYHYDGRVEKQK